MGKRSQSYSEYQYSQTGVLARRNLPTPVRPPRPSAARLQELGITAKGTLVSNGKRPKRPIRTAASEDENASDDSYDGFDTAPRPRARPRNAADDGDAGTDGAHDGDDAGTDGMDQDPDDAEVNGWGTSRPTHCLPELDVPEKMGEVLRNMDDEHRFKLLQKAQAALTALNYVGACLCCDTKLVLAEAILLPLRERPPEWLQMLEYKDEYDLTGDQHREYYTVVPPAGSFHIAEWQKLVASPRAQIPDELADKLEYERDHIAVCKVCKSSLKRKQRPKDSTINFNWEAGPECIEALKDLSQQERTLLDRCGRSFVGLHTYYLLPTGSKDEDGVVITRPRL